MRSNLSRLHVACLALLATVAASPLAAKELTCEVSPDLASGEWLAVWPCESDLCEEQSSQPSFPNSKRSSLQSPVYVPPRIVGLDEADLKLNTVSVTSPIARALIGKYAGDVVEVQAPSGPREYEILEVKYI